MNDKHLLWVEKYRPQTLDTYIFHDENQRVAIEQMIENKTIPHLLLSGVAGSGKTTLARIIIKELGLDPIDVLTLNASDENNVDVMRTKIKTFITTYAMGTFKVVHLEEADYITPNGQAILRSMMEEYADTARFILTCNYENKIIPAIRSRCQQFKFQKHDKDEVTEFLAQILFNEKIKFDLELLDRYIRIGYPDIRKIINSLQLNSQSGKLLPLVNDSSSSDYKFALLDLLERDRWAEARTLICNEVSDGEWEDVFRFLYENIEKCPKFQNKEKWEEGVVTIATYLYKHSLVADPEINVAAMFIQLGQI